MKHVQPTISLIIVTALMLCTDAAAQRSNDTWLFGDQIRFDFDGNVIQQSRGNTSVVEGTACYSDPQTGDLLVYTDGATIYGSDGQPITNGLNMPSGPSGTQNSLIVPQPDSDSLLWFFFANDRTNSTVQPRGLWYSVVDLTADNGRPSVVLKNIRLSESTSEKLTGTRDCETGEYWVLTHDNTRPEFTAYHLTKDGIVATVISTAGPAFNGPEGYKQGYLRFSASGTKLVMASTEYGRVELFDFDRATGEVSFRTVLGEIDDAYGVSFSPNEEFIYAAGYQVNQYQTSPPYNEVVLGVLTGAFARRVSPAIQRTPTGQLLIPDQDSIIMIARPNEEGLACGYDEGTFRIFVGTAYSGLPNFMDHLFYTDAELGCSLVNASLPPDTAICVGESITFEAPSSIESLNYEWTFQGADPGSSDLRTPEPVTYNTIGVYQVQLVVSNGFSSDTATMSVTVNSLPTVTISQSSQACYGDPIELEATGGIVYRWDDDATLSSVVIENPTVIPETSRFYYVEVTNKNGCTTRDSIFIELKPPGVRAELRPQVTVSTVGELGRFVVVNKTDVDVEPVTFSFDVNMRHFAEPTLLVGSNLQETTVGADTRRITLTSVAGRDTIAEFEMLTLLAEADRTVNIGIDKEHGCDTLIVSPREIDLVVQNCGSAQRSVLFSHTPLEIKSATRTGNDVALQIDGVLGQNVTIRVCNLIGQVVFQQVVTLPYSGRVNELPLMSPLLIQVFSSVEQAVVLR